MLKKISHIGIAVRNLKNAIAFYEKLGLEVEGIETIEDQKVKVAFLPLGEVRLELLEATADSSPIARFIEKKGEGLHHIAMQTDEVKADLKKAEENDIKLIDKKPRNGAHNSKIAFLHPKDSFGVLLEFCEESDN